MYACVKFRKNLIFPSDILGIDCYSQMKYAEARTKHNDCCLKKKKLFCILLI